MTHPIIKILAPTTASVTEGVATAIPGLRLNEKPQPGETFTETLTDTHGLLWAKQAPGVSGNRTTTLTLTGRMSFIINELLTVTDTDDAAGADTIAITASDSLGHSATPVNIAVTAAPPAAIRSGLAVDNTFPTKLRIGAPANASITQGVATKIAGMRLYENNGVVGKTYSVTLTDTNGHLSCMGTGTITGSGTNSITFTGTMSQVNHDLSVLKDRDTVAGADSIQITATDLTAGISATPVSIAVTVTPPASRVPAFIAAMAGHTGAGSALHSQSTHPSATGAALLAVAQR